MHVEEFLKRTDVDATDAENDAFCGAFYKYVQSQLTWELSDIDRDALADMERFMSMMITEHGYDISRQHQHVLETIAERDERAEQRANDGYRGWNDERRSERADEEAILSMFDSLK